MTEEAVHFSSALPITVLDRPAGSDADWQEVDRGPGYFHVPADREIRVRIKGIGDADLPELINELREVPTLRFLDLAENRNITNDGLARLRGLPQLTGLNLSSCTITDSGLNHLRELPKLAYLDLSYCNRLTDASLKTLESQRSITDVNMQSCLAITKGGLARLRRRSLNIHR